MSESEQGWRVIPRMAWMVAVLMGALTAFLIVVGPVQFEREIREWPLELLLLLIIAPAVAVFLYVLLVGYVYGDAKRRGMRAPMWAWISLIPYFVGVAAYFILRDPLPQPCPSCNTPLPARFAFCPHCGAGVAPFCPHCGKPSERGWVNCAYCGVTLRASVQKTEAS